MDYNLKLDTPVTGDADLALGRCNKNDLCLRIASSGDANLYFGLEPEFFNQLSGDIALPDIAVDAGIGVCNPFDLCLRTPPDGSANLFFGDPPDLSQDLDAGITLADITVTARFYNCGANDLCLRIPQDGTANLKFGFPPINPATVNLSCTVYLQELSVDGSLFQATELGGEITLAEVSVLGVINPLCELSGAIALPEITTEGYMPYLVNVWRGPQGSPVLPFEEGADTPLFTVSPFRPQTHRPRNENASDWQQGFETRAEARAPFDFPPRSEDSAVMPWQETQAAVSELSSRFADPPRSEDSLVLPWGEATARFDELNGGYFHPPRQQATRLLPAENALATGISSAVPYIYPPKRKKEYFIPWEEAYWIVSLWPRTDLWQPPPPLPRVITPDLALLCPRVLTGDLRFGQVCSGEIPRYIPVKRSYIVIHDINVRRVSDNTLIHAARVSLSLDADSWAWGFSATLLGKEALAAVQPVGGAPVELSITINSYEWLVLVEDWTESREFGKRAISVKGRGLSSMLASPYQLPGSGVTDSLMTVQQLLEAHLPIGEGWALSWDAAVTPWNIPAGAWTWQNHAAINAIHAAVSGAGLVLVPSRNSKSLSVVERYPVLPWDYSAATPDFIIPDAAILSLSRQQAIATQANAVYVQGGDVGGILARVYRTGTAGDRVAATQSSPLITDVSAARLLGERILAGQHEQPTVRGVTTTLGGSFPLAKIGDLLRVELDAAAHFGIVNALNIEAQMQDKVTVRQTLNIGETTPNQWSQFKRLLPSDPLLTGVIDASNGDGTVTVELTGGGLVRVRGSGSVGQRVYVRGGMVEGNAPSMVAVDIEV